MKYIDRQENKRRQINWLLTGLFMFHLIVGHVAFQGYVLCLGFDGHVAIESSADRETCSDGAAENSPGESGAVFHHNDLVTADHCGICIDVPIGSDCHEFAKPQPEKRVPQPLALALKANLYEHVTSPETGHSITNYRSAIHKNPSLVSLQTTVLLI